MTLGGASVGDFDLVQQTALAHGLALDFYRVAMRPGKPLMAGRFNGVPLVGLPGNPVSAMVCGHVFLRPAIARMLGLPGDLPAPLPARLGCDLGPNGPRAHYMRARVEPAPRRLALHPVRAPGQLAPDACWPRPTRCWSARRATRRGREGDTVEFIWL